MNQLSRNNNLSNNTCQIIIKGKLSLQDWENWFEGFELANVSPGETMLTGPIVDQAQLFAILTKLRDVGISILSVSYFDR